MNIIWVIASLFADSPLVFVLHHSTATDTFELEHERTGTTQSDINQLIYVGTYVRRILKDQRQETRNQEKPPHAMPRQTRASVCGKTRLGVTQTNSKLETQDSKRGLR